MNHNYDIVKLMQKGSTLILLISLGAIISIGIVIGFFYFNNNSLYSGARPTVDDSTFSYSNIVSDKISTESSYPKGNAVWGKPIIYYSVEEIRDLILNSEKAKYDDFFTEADVNLMAESCAPVISKYIYAFPGYKYEKFVTHLNSINALRIEAYGKEEDTSIVYGMPERDQYIFDFNFNPNPTSCKLTSNINEIVGSMRQNQISREFVPKDIQNMAINYALGNQLVKERIKDLNYKVNILGWEDEGGLNEPTTSEVDQKVKDFFIKQSPPFAVVTLYFKLQDETEFPVLVNVMGGQIYVMHQTKKAHGSFQPN